MKACYDCKNYQSLSQIVGPRACIGSKTIDRVSGTPKHESCESMRADGGECGPDAKLFVQKDVEHL